MVHSMKRRVQQKVMIMIILVMSGCAHQKKVAPALVNKNEHHLQAVLWFQTAAEVTALQYMAFNIARDRLDQELRKKKMKKRKAIVVDIDETVLDNSSYQANNILNQRSFPEGWQDWVDRAKATPIPGSKEFLKYAHLKGVEILYVTNRKVPENVGTYQNLIEVGFPVKKENIFYRTNESSKKVRRDLVGKKYDIVLLMGDNLGDFSEVFEEQDISTRRGTVDQLKEKFGRKWIVLPNPMYGDWESTIHQHNYKKTDEEKNEDRIKNLKTFGY